MTAHYIDTHCHLASDRFAEDRDRVVEACLEKNVRMLAVAGDVESSRRSVELAAFHDGVLASVGVHPNDTGRLDEESWGELEGLAASSLVVAIGETGLDYYWKDVDPGVQKAWFKRHLELAKTVGKPVLVHARDSVPDVLAMLEPHIGAGNKAVWHCFCAGKKIIKDAFAFAVKHGLYLGVGGMATFEDQPTLRQYLAEIPDALLLLETDSPYLSPRPKTSDRNDPRGVIRVAEELARLRRVSVEDIARITTRNACRLFGFPLPEHYSGVKCTYAIRNSLYVALTSQCNNQCLFCLRGGDQTVKGHDLNFAADPSEEDVLDALENIGEYAEVVMCGLGEPTLRLDLLKRAARKAKDQGVTVRLNTNGLGNRHHGENILPGLKGLVDTLSVSINTADPDQYDKLCRPLYESGSHAEVCDFVRKAVAEGFDIICTVVAAPGIDVEAARKLVESLGAKFRVREFNNLG